MEQKLNLIQDEVVTLSRLNLNKLKYLSPTKRFVALRTLLNSFGIEIILKEEENSILFDYIKSDKIEEKIDELKTQLVKYNHNR